MTASSSDLRKIATAARPIIEEWLDCADKMKGLREAATTAGIDWQPIKSLIKAQILDERDGKERVKAILEKAESATLYADMLGWGGENKNFSEAAE